MKSGIFFPEVKIEDLIRLAVIFEDYYEHLDKKILDYTAVSVDE